MDIRSLWDFDDLAASEARFRRLLADAQGDDALSLRTQIARTHSLRRQFAEAHAELDAMLPALDAAGAEPRVRHLLERGRTLRSAGERQHALPLFAQAVDRARAARLDELMVDAMHMRALVEPDTADQLAWNDRALAAALASDEPNARAWEGSLANNIGMSLHGVGRFDEALASFRQALAARERDGKPRQVRIAQWMVAWTLRAMKRHPEALALQQRLEQEWAAAGEVDGWVYAELGENLALLGREAEAGPWFSRAIDALANDLPDADTLARWKAVIGGRAQWS
jgi:tetratricopeptide (TPR) repeat protein